MKGVGKVALIVLVLLIVIIVSLLLTFKVLGAVPSFTLVAPTGVSGSPTLLNLTNVSRGYFELNFTSNISFYTVKMELINISAGTGGNVSASIIVNGSDSSRDNYTFNNFTDLINGSYSIQVNFTGNLSIDNTSAFFSINFTVDTQKPTVTADLPGNATNTTDTTPEISVNVTDMVATSGINVSLWVDGSLNGSSKIVVNNTNVRFNLSAQTNGTHRFQVQAIDPAGNSQNSTLITLVVDDTAPTNINIKSPVNGGNASGTTMEFTVNATDGIAAADLNFTLYFSQNTTKVGSVLGANNTNVLFNTTTLNDNKYEVYLTVTDPAGNGANSSWRNFSIDGNAPLIQNFTLTPQINDTDASLRLLFDINDTTPTSCSAIIRGTSNTWNINITGILTGSNQYKNCNVTVSRFNLTGEGRFTIEPKGLDAFNNTGLGFNFTNNTYVLSNNGGWTLLAAQTNRTLRNLANNLSNNVTQVSIWSNQNKNYTTWVRGLGTDENLTVKDGDPIYVYTGKSVAFLRVWNMTTTGTQPYNVSVYAGWNQLSSFNNTGYNLSRIVNQTVYNETNMIQEFKYASFHNASNNVYKSHFKNFTVHADILVPKGYAYWVKINGTGSGNYSTFRQIRGTLE